MAHQARAGQQPQRYNSSVLVSQAAAVAVADASANRLRAQRGGFVITVYVNQTTCEKRLACNSGAIGDEKHMVFECTALAPLRQQYADLFTPRTETMRSFFAQQDHLGVLNYVIDCLNFMNM